MTPGLLALFLSGCLIDEARYQRRLEDLTDADGDGFVKEDECDDGDAAVNPGAPERCDGVDQDCDGDVDEDAADAPTWYADADGDGYGDREDAQVRCEAPAGFVADATDCDDALGTVHPGAEETAYDGVDQDCSGADTDDLDGDGYAGGTGGADCDDADAEVHPGAEETWGNGFGDEDCDGELESIVEQFGAEAWTGGTAGANAGRRVAAAGDTDGDGVAELLVGAPMDSGLYASGGAVYLVSGTPGGSLEAFPAFRADGATEFVGASLAGGVDVDGDGLPDALIGATGVDDGTGAVWVVSGALLGDGGVAASLASATLRGDAPSSYFGSHVAFVGDLDGDGGQEIAVSAPYADVGGAEGAGVVGVWGGWDIVSGRVGEAPIVITGSEAGATIGNRVEGAGDVDGDGYEDLLVSSAGGTLAVVLPGGGAMAIEAPLFELQPSAELASADVRMLGDVDGDGSRDLAAVTADVLIFTALPGTPARSLGEPSAEIRVGERSFLYDIVDIGDLDDDGRAEVLVPTQWYDPVGTGVVGIFRGSELVFGTDVTLADASLEARSVRPASGFGYRAVVAGDLDGDGVEELALGGFYDDVGGADAGAVTTLVLPR